MTKYFYGQAVEDDGVSYYVHIKKPIYGHCVAINRAIIQAAITNGRLLVVSCPGASEVIPPRAWVNRARRIEKVFRRPDEPMVLYQATVGNPQPEKQDSGKATQMKLI